MERGRRPKAVSLGDASILVDTLLLVTFFHVFRKLQRQELRIVRVAHALCAGIVTVTIMHFVQEHVFGVERLREMLEGERNYLFTSALLATGLAVLVHQWYNRCDRGDVDCIAHDPDVDQRHHVRCRRFKMQLYGPVAATTAGLSTVLVGLRMNHALGGSVMNPREGTYFFSVLFSPAIFVGVGWLSFLSAWLLKVFIELERREAVAPSPGQRVDWPAAPCRQGWSSNPCSVGGLQPHLPLPSHLPHPTHLPHPAQPPQWCAHHAGVLQHGAGWHAEAWRRLENEGGERQAAAHHGGKAPGRAPAWSSAPTSPAARVPAPGSIASPLAHPAARSESLGDRGGADLGAAPRSETAPAHRRIGGVRPLTRVTRRPLRAFELCDGGDFAHLDSEDSSDGSSAAEQAARRIALSRRAGAPSLASRRLRRPRALDGEPFDVGGAVPGSMHCRSWRRGVPAEPARRRSPGGTDPGAERVLGAAALPPAGDSSSEASAASRDRPRGAEGAICSHEGGAGSLHGGTFGTGTPTRGEPLQCADSASAAAALAAGASVRAPSADRAPDAVDAANSGAS